MNREINAPLHDRPHYVYRLFDENDQLIYIGCARDVEGRVDQHTSWPRPSRTSDYFWHHTARYTSVEYPNHRLARIAERQAIESEAPLLNRFHNPRRFKRLENGQFVALEVVLEPARS